MKAKLLFGLCFCVLLVSFLVPSTGPTEVNDNSGKKAESPEEDHRNNCRTCPKGTKLDLNEASNHDDGKCEEMKMLPLVLIVKDCLNQLPVKAYHTCIAYRGILIGAMKRLMDSDQGFSFTYREDPNYGPFLESVNGVAGNDTEQTYWELLAKKPDGEFNRTDVGIGCYIPEQDEQIMLNFTTW